MPYLYLNIPITWRSWKTGVAVLLILHFFGVSLDAQSFVRSRPPECQCRFEMPGIPKQTVETIQTDVGPIAFYSYSMQVTSGKDDLTVFAVSFADYPEDALQLDSTDFLKDFFQATIEQAVEQTGGTLIYETDAYQDAYPGRLYRIDYGDGQVVKSKAFLVDKRFYLVQGFYAQNTELVHTIDRFIESFRILK
jgi:hypothetical protein